MPATQLTRRTGEKLNEPWSFFRVRDSYLDYLNSKVAEINEQRVARRYDSNNQLTAGQIEAIQARNMAPVIFNRITRKIDGMIGTLARLKQDPKAYPRTEKERDGADLATQVVNFVLDENDWATKSSESARHAAVDALGIMELNLQPDPDHPGDMEIELNVIDPADYFYDPRTFTLDFADCRYDGVGKWFTVEEALDLRPGDAEWADQILQVANHFDRSLTSEPDKDEKWFIFNSDFNLEKVRIVEIWYKHQNGYRWALFTGSSILDEGDGYLFDGKGRQISKYIKFAARRDNDGDAYSFIRSMKYAQDEINAWKMGLNYDILSRRIIIEGDIPQNVEKIRKEWARKDGTVVLPNGAKAVLDNKQTQIEGAILAINEAKAEIENYGLNANVFGDNNDIDLSGRAISLLQQAGLAELGPFVVQYRKWKIAIYRAVWAQVQRYWSEERWIRVTDDEQVAQFFMVNQLTVDPTTNALMIQNAVGELDVDIIMDEGPDYINAMQETFDNLQAMIARGVNVPPELVIEMSNLDSKTKRRMLETLQEAKQPDPMAQQGIMLELQKLQAEVQKLNSETAKNIATAETTAPNPLNTAEQIAGIEKTQAETVKTLSDANGQPAPSQNPLEQMLDMLQKQANVENTRAKTANELSNAFNNGRDEATFLDNLEQMTKIRKTEAETDKIDVDAATAMRPEPPPDQQTQNSF